MRTLIGFILKNYFLLLFLFFEALSFFLIYHTANYQRQSIISVSSGVTGRMNEIYTDITGYFRLSRENEILARENARLRSLIPTDTVKYPQHDTAFSYISAKVVSNSIHKRNNYFILNKGQNHGIETEMGIISPGGVAGIIVSTSRNFATAMSVLNKDSRISGRIKKNGQLVNVVWDGRDYRIGKVVDIPTHLDLFPGDTIITSGNSLIFPEGLPIGTIREYFVNRDQLFNSASLEFATDFNSLYYVYVIGNRNMQELKKLTEPLTDE